MIRRIIEIDEERCTGCGLCAKACHEGAIAMVNGKAKLAREHFCDGSATACPPARADAIRFVEREAPAYDEAAVQAAKAAQYPAGGCPGAQAMRFTPVRRTRAGRRGVRPAELARADQAAEHLGTLSAGCGPCHCRGLHGVFLRAVPQPLSCRAHRHDRLSEARRRGLQRKAHGAVPPERHPLRPRRADAGTVAAAA